MDVDSQFIISKAKQINLLFTHEFPVYDKVIKLFCSQRLEYFDIRRNHKYIYKQISKKILSSIIEYLAIIF
ncbi:MAG: hypothetical protein ACTTN6_01535 [Arsenophonus sp.]